MGKYYRERFEAQQRIARKLASTMEVNEILEMLREETRILVPSAMEACILLLDPDAIKYTDPCSVPSMVDPSTACPASETVRPSRRPCTGRRASSSLRASPFSAATAPRWKLGRRRRFPYS